MDSRERNLCDTTRHEIIVKDLITKKIIRTQAQARIKQLRKQNLRASTEVLLYAIENKSFDAVDLLYRFGQVRREGHVSDKRVINPTNFQIEAKDAKKTTYHPATALPIAVISQCPPDDKLMGLLLEKFSDLRGVHLALRIAQHKKNLGVFKKL